MTEHRIHTTLPHAEGSRFRPRGPQPAVSATQRASRMQGDIDLARLAIAASHDLQRAERKGLVTQGSNIQNPALRQLVKEAKRDLGRLTANRRADTRRQEDRA